MRKNSGSKIIFFFLCFEGAVISFNIASIAAIVPAIAADLGRDKFEVARMISYYMIPYGLAALIYAPLVKKYSVKSIKLACLFIFALASLISGFSVTLPMLFSSRIVAGIAASATTPIALILTGELAQKEVRGRMLGAFFSSTFIASLAGVLLSGILPWRQLFILPAIFAGINLILVLLFFDPSISLMVNPERSRRIDFKSKAGYDFSPARAEDSVKAQEVNYLKVLKDERIFGIFAYILILSLVYHGIYNWLGVYFSSLDFPQVKVSLLLGLVGFSGIFGQLFGGWVTDKKGRVFAATSGLILLSLAAGLLIKPFSFVYLAVTLFVFGIGWTMNHNAVSTVLTDLPDNLRPELASLNSAVRFASGGLGVSLAGIFMRKSFTLTFLGLGLIILFLAATTNRILK